jgi:hypothetical protein
MLLMLIILRFDFYLVVPYGCALQNAFSIEVNKAALLAT